MITFFISSESGSAQFPFIKLLCLVFLIVMATSVESTSALAAFTAVMVTFMVLETMVAEKKPMLSFAIVFVITTGVVLFTSGITAGSLWQATMGLAFLLEVVGSSHFLSENDPAYDPA